MEYKHSQSMALEFEKTQMEMRRPFYLLRAEVNCKGDYYEAKHGGISGFGITPALASVAFDLIWLNGGVATGIMESK